MNEKLVALTLVVPRRADTGPADAESSWLEAQHAQETYRVYEYSDVLDAARRANLQGRHEPQSVDDGAVLEAHFHQPGRRPIYLHPPGFGAPLEAMIGTGSVVDPVLQVRSVPTLLRTGDVVSVPYAYLTHGACEFCRRVRRRRPRDGDGATFVLLSRSGRTWQLMDPQALRRVGVHLETLSFRSHELA